MTSRPARWVLSIAATFAFVVSGVVAPDLAGAAGEAPVITKVSTPVGHPETLIAEVTSTDPVTSVTAVVRADDASSTTDVSFVFDAASSTWRADLSSLELGGYGADVTAHTTAADSATLRFSWWFMLQGLVQDLSVAPLSLGPNAPLTTATGTVAVFDPRTGQTKSGGQGQPVSAWIDSAGTPLTTAYVQADDTTGQFSISLGAGSGIADPHAKLVVRWWPDDFYAEPVPEETELELAGGTAPYRITVDKAVHDVIFPLTATVAGTVERQVGDVWVPAENALVTTTGGAPWRDGRQRTAKVGSTGRFALVGPVPLANTAFTVRLAPASAVYAEVKPSVRVAFHVKKQTTLKWTVASLRADGDLLVQGQLSMTGGAFCTCKVHVETSKNGRTGWTSLGWVTTSSRGKIPATTGHPDHPNWAFRLSFRGNSTLVPSTSAVRRFGRADTRIARYSVSPTTITKGAKVTVSGKVETLSGSTWKSIGTNQEVQIFFRPTKSSPFTYKGSARTSSSGAFKGSFKATKDGYWSAVWFTHTVKKVNAYSTEKYVNVR